MIEVKINAGAVVGFLEEARRKLLNTAPLMAGIAATLHNETEANFATQGRPRWMGLSPRTLKRRGASARILQDSGQLAASIQTFHDASTAGIGSNKVYAAIHQLGGEVSMPARSQQLYFKQHKNGEVGRRFVRKQDSNFAQWATLGGHGIKIPARPYLPVDASGNLQPEAETAVMGVVQGYLRNLGTE